jgi:hypothetical protein
MASPSIPVATLEAAILRHGQRTTVGGLDAALLD